MNTYQTHLDELRIKQMIADVENMQLIVLLKDDKAYNKLLNKLRDAIATAYDEVTRAALKECVEYLVNKGSASFLPGDATAIDEILQKKLGKDFESVVTDDINKLTQDILKLGKVEVLKPIGMKLSFDVKDVEASKILAEQNLFWVGGHYNENLKKKFDELTAGYFDSDKTIEQIADDFEKNFGKLTEQGQQYFYDLAEHQTNTVRELGKVNGFEQAGVRYYEIRAIIDDRTSEICQRMNGTIFPVERAVEYRDNILSLKDPEAIKEASPWLSPEEVNVLPSDDGELPPGLSLPPYHFRCRTICVAYFEQ